mmetsp:Transcript_11664/g.27060  ORF Transcript_11664/g.27060 Transcript_11664/m.27060 type:complete len:209 (+) Transcript_11664:138-764(+)
MDHAASAPPTRSTGRTTTAAPPSIMLSASIGLLASSFFFFSSSCNFFQSSSSMGCSILFKMEMAPPAAALMAALPSSADCSCTFSIEDMSFCLCSSSSPVERSSRGSLVPNPIAAILASKSSSDRVETGSSAFFFSSVSPSAILRLMCLARPLKELCIPLRTAAHEAPALSSPAKPLPRSGMLTNPSAGPHSKTRRVAKHSDFTIAFI